MHSEYLESASLEPAQRSELVGRLFEVYNETVRATYTRGEFEALVFGAGDVRLALFHGSLGELAGFSYVGTVRLEHAGRKHAVFHAGAYFRRGYHCGVSAALFGLRHALRFKLREPRTPLAYVTRNATPAAYLLIASAMPRVYPGRGLRTPADVEALVREFSTRQQYVAIGDNPWVVHSVATPRDASRLRRLDHDPDVRFYLTLNPRFAEGESLLSWVPLDLADVASGFYRSLRRRVSR